MSLFDQKDLAEIHSPEFPSERLVACFNPLLAEQRGRKRAGADEGEPKKSWRRIVQAKWLGGPRSPLGKDEIGKKVGKVIGRFKMGKHFMLTIEEGNFSYMRNEERIRREEALDGIYVIRTSEPTERLSAARHGA